MERKFESELAGQVARRHKNPVASRAKVLVMAVVSCAVMVGAAAAVLSLGANAALGGETAYTSVMSGEDYLVCDESGEVVYATDLLDDELFMVKRTSDLKYCYFDTPGNSPVIYTKVVYSVNVKLRDISLLGDVSGMIVSEVSIGGFDAIDPEFVTFVTANVAVNGISLTADDGTPLDASEYLVWAYDVALKTISATVNLPTYTYNAESDDMVSIFVMFKVPQSGLSITGSEIGFPAYQVVEEPEIIP